MLFLSVLPLSQLVWGIFMGINKVINYTRENDVYKIANCKGRWVGNMEKKNNYLGVSDLERHSWVLLGVLSTTSPIIVNFPWIVVVYSIVRTKALAVCKTCNSREKSLNLKSSSFLTWCTVPVSPSFSPKPCLCHGILGNLLNSFLTQSEPQFSLRKNKNLKVKGCCNLQIDCLNREHLIYHA